MPLLCQVPLAPHVCVSVPQLPQATGCVWPGAQTPVHDAAPAPCVHVWLVQVAGAAQSPVVLHVETPLLAHRVAPGVHVPWQDAVSPLCMQAWFVHPTAVPHIPLLPQLCTAALPEHWELPCVHDPEHMPPTQIDLLQATGALQTPVVLQVSTPPAPPLSASLAHVVEPGAQEPMQTPPAHAWPEQVFTGTWDSRSASHSTTVVALPQALPPGLAPVHSGSRDAHIP